MWGANILPALTCECEEELRIRLSAEQGLAEIGFKEFNVKWRHWPIVTAYEGKVPNRLKGARVTTEGDAV